MLFFQHIEMTPSEITEKQPVISNTLAGCRTPTKSCRFFSNLENGQQIRMMSLKIEIMTMQRNVQQGNVEDLTEAAIRGVP